MGSFNKYFEQFDLLSTPNRCIELIPSIPLAPQIDWYDEFLEQVNIFDSLNPSLN